MPFVISAPIPFPNLYWLASVYQNDGVMWDAQINLLKASFHNRYLIATANGPTLLSIPLHKGREQRAALSDLMISYSERWQQQHWRTIKSAYMRSPYFEFFETELETLFTQHFPTLIDFNMASVRWTYKTLKMILKEKAVTPLLPDNALDVRFLRPQRQQVLDTFPRYYQVFIERTGFLPNLSALDLIMMEGPAAAGWLKNNAQTVVGSVAFIERN